VLSGERPRRKLVLVHDARLRMLILRCWDDEPKMRPTAKQIVDQVCLFLCVCVSVCACVRVCVCVGRAGLQYSAQTLE
jgi:hypothetical protein